MTKLKELSTFEKILFKAFKDDHVQGVVVSFLKSTQGGFIRSWLVGFVANNFFDHLIEPFMDEMRLRRINEINFENGKIRLGRYNDADNDDDRIKYGDDILG